MFIKSLILFICIFLSSPLRADTSPDELFTAASQAFHNGFSDVAIRYCEEFISEFPSHEKLNETKYLLGQSYFLKNRFEDALTIFDSLKGSTVEQDGVLFWLAESYLKVNDKPKAIAVYQQIISNFPNSNFVVQAMYSLAWAYMDEGQSQKAKEIFIQITKQYEANPLAEDAWLKAIELTFNEGLMQESVDLSSAFAKKFPQSVRLAEIWFNVAEAYYGLGNYSAALDYYQKSIVIQSDPSSRLSALVGQMWSLVKLGKANEVKRLVVEAKALILNNRLNGDDFYLNLGNLYLEANESLLAVSVFNDLIATKPVLKVLDQAYLGRANAYFANKNYTEAKNDYLKLLQSDQSDVKQKAQYGLGWLMVKLGEADKAIGYFKEIVDHADDQLIKSNALLQMADAYQDTGKLKESIDIYQRLMLNESLGLSFDYILYRKAMALLKLDQAQDAMVVLDQLRQQYPKSAYMADIYYYVGVAAFKKGDWALAKSSMNDFLRDLTKPSEFTPQANYIMAIAMLNLHQTDDALKVFQKILRLYPDNLVVARNADLGIAKCLVDLNQSKEAQKRFKLIVFKYPKTDTAYEALMWLAKNELKNSNASEAIVYYQQAIKDFPDHDMAESLYYELAQSYDMLADATNALQYYRMIKKDESLLIKAKFASAELLAKDVNVNQAIEVYASIIKEQPAFAREASVKLGELYRSLQQYEKEMDVYQKALKVQDGSAVVSDNQLHFLLADILELMSRTDEAIEQYLQIGQNLAKDPSWAVKAYLRVAKIYEDGEDWQGARLTYQKIVSLNTDESKYAQERLDLIKNNVSRKR